MDGAPTNQAKRWGMSPRKGPWDGVTEPRSSTGGQCFHVQDRGGRCCLRALAEHDTNVEFTPEGHRELSKAFRQKSARLKQAFLKGAPAVLWGAEHGGRGPDEARGLEPPRGEQEKGQTRSLIWV